MKSITKEITSLELMAQIRMERQTHEGAFLLIEGNTDYKRFSKFISDDCSIVICFGKSNVIDTIEQMQDAGAEDCLGLVDADFDRILGTHQLNDDIASSQFHDFDLDMATTPACTRYLERRAHQHRLEAVGGCDQLIRELLEALKPLSVLRFANVKHGLDYSLKDVDVTVLFDGRTFDVDVMVDMVSSGRYSSEGYRTALRSHIDHYQKANFDLWQLTNGHDFMAALGITLRHHVGSCPIDDTVRSAIERHLRSELSEEDFERTGLPKLIILWEQSRPRMTVLKRSIH